MKRLSIALAAVGISVSALAALPAATDPTIVAVPQLPGGFFIGGTAYYLQPSDTNGDLDYATLSTLTLSTIAGVFTTIKNIEPDYDWGWGANVGYIFPGTGNDIEATYFHLDTNDDDSVSGAFNPGFLVAAPFATGNIASPIIPGLNSPTFLAEGIATLYGLGSIISGISSVTSSVDYRFNRADLTLGQYIDVGCRLVLHPKLGVTWAEVKRDITTDASATVVGTLLPITPPAFNAVRVDERFEENSRFRGVGPMFGIDSSYYIADGFGLVGHLNTALLVGDVDNSTAVGAVASAVLSPSGTILFTTPAAVAVVDTDNTRRVVPVVDGKLGLDYTFVFNNTANSDLTLEAGWQVTNYFNAVDRSITAPRTTSDVGLNGPYVSLVFHV